MVRSGYTSKPRPLPMRPALFRPQPSVRAIELSAWPGRTHTPAVIELVADGDLDHVLALDAERPGGGRRHDGRVVPDQLGDRVRHLLEPGVVRVSAVDHLRAGRERDLERARAHGSRESDLADRRGDVGGVDGRRWSRRGRTRRDSHGQRAVPLALQVRSADRHSVARRVVAIDLAIDEGAAPGEAVLGKRRGANRRADGLVRRLLGRVREQREQLDVVAPVVERGDEGLLDADAPVERALVAPRLVRVGARDVPGALLARLVDEERRVHAEGHLRSLSAKPRSAGRVVDGVAPEDDERLDLVGGDRVGQRLEIGDRVELVGIGDGGMIERRAGRAEGGVHGVRERVEARRLARADHDERPTAVGREVLGDRPRATSRGARRPPALATLRWMSSPRLTPFFASSTASA